MDIIDTIEHIVTSLTLSIPDVTIRKQIENAKTAIIDAIKDATTLPISHLIRSMNTIDLQIKDGVLCMEPSS